MTWWVYKCNSKRQAHQVVFGDWEKFFDSTASKGWGRTEDVPPLNQLRRGHQIIAYQTDRNELVGLATVNQMKPRGEFLEVILKPGERIGVQIRPLKRADPQIDRIPALKAGPIKTIYPITDRDAARLISAARAARKRATSQEAELTEPELELAEEEFREGEQRASMSTARNPKLRLAAKKRWGLHCYCCGFEFGQFYGKIAHGAAIVHHLNSFVAGTPPRHSTVEDVRVVCANCHLVIHLTNPPRGVDWLKSKISGNWTSWSTTGIVRHAE